MTEFHDDPAVRKWLASLAEQWGGTPDPTVRLAVLERFCDEVGQSPAEMIEACTTRSEDGRPLTTIKGINRYWKLIEARRSTWGQDSSRHLMSFFIHNGVLMQSPV